MCARPFLYLNNFTVSLSEQQQLQFFLNFNIFQNLMLALIVVIAVQIGHNISIGIFQELYATGDIF